ncbi:MAG: hypothetical protein K5896_10165 [Prevotella sp.]|jgi:outer membrane lipoprotein SlyB|nr:hypothetical protein [Prevotella sp.]
MKKVLIMMIGASLLLSSCYSYEGAGAYTGSMFGNMVGSAIGGIAGGWRGHEIGALVGTVGGAVIGASVGRATEERQERKHEERAARRRQQRYEQRAEQRRSQRYDQAPATSAQRQMAHVNSGNGEALVIRNAAIYEENEDGKLTRGEKCTVVFEIANTTSNPVYNVYPLVDERTGNKHIHISPNMRIESLSPHQAIRYTAQMVADNGLKDGQVEVLVGVAQGNNIVDSQTRAFHVPTAKR